MRKFIKIGAKEKFLREAQFVKNSKDFDELEIDFMGGEPLMNFPLIKEIVEWLETGVIDILFNDIDGKKYGCHMFTLIVLRDKALLADGVDWEAPESTTNDYCKSCALRTFYPTCPGFNYKYRGHIAARDKCCCPIILAETMTACEFQVERIVAVDKLDEKDAQYGQAELQAYKILKDFDIEKSQSPYTI